jgi:hypothetical protein
MESVQLCEVISKIIERSSFLLLWFLLLCLLLLRLYCIRTWVGLVPSRRGWLQHATCALPTGSQSVEHVSLAFLLLLFPLLQILRVLFEQLIDGGGGRRVGIEDVRLEAEWIHKVRRDVVREWMQIGGK